VVTARARPNQELHLTAAACSVFEVRRLAGRRGRCAVAFTLRRPLATGSRFLEGIMFSWLRTLFGTKPSAGGGRQRRSASGGLFLVFGPAVAECPFLAVESARRGIPHVGAARAEELARADGLTPSDKTLAPCTLVFCHFIPSQASRAGSEQEIRLWIKRFHQKLLDRGLLARPQEGAEVSPGLPEVTWLMDARKSLFFPKFCWGAVRASTCIGYARKLEELYALLEEGYRRQGRRGDGGVIGPANPG
jgi:hypothetical protein